MPRSEKITPKPIFNRIQKNEIAALRKVKRNSWDSSDGAAYVLLDILNGDPRHFDELIKLLDDLCRLKVHIENLQSLPVIDGCQPTQGEIQSTLKPLMTITEKLRDTIGIIPHELLEHVKVPLPNSGKVTELSIEIIATALANAAKQEYHRYDRPRKNGKKISKQGRKSKNKMAPVNIGVQLLIFAKKIAPRAEKKQVDDFVIGSLDLIGARNETIQKSKKLTHELLEKIYHFSGLT